MTSEQVIADRDRMIAELEAKLAAADPATVIELCRLARRGMDAAVAGR